MYKYTQHNLLENPITYQFSDVSEDNFLKDYLKQREEFLLKIKDTVEDTFFVFTKNIDVLNYQEILTLQKKFEVRKSFFNEYNKDISFITLFSFQLTSYLKEIFCLSLFSTLLKINDTLSSLKIDDFSSFEIYILNDSIKNELSFFKRLINE